MRIIYFATTIVALLLFSKIVSTCMQMKVKDEGGRIQCRDCEKCGAGLEPYPRCGEKTVFDLKNFSQVCKPCKEGHFKGTPGEVPNDLQCKPCDQVKCRENFEEIYPCTKKRPALCSDSCKKGFEKDNSGNCIKPTDTTDRSSTVTTAKITSKKLKPSTFSSTKTTSQIRGSNTTPGKPTDTTDRSSTVTTAKTTSKKLKPSTFSSTKTTSQTRNSNTTPGKPTDTTDHSNTLTTVTFKHSTLSNTNTTSQRTNGNATPGKVMNKKDDLKLGLILGITFGAIGAVILCVLFRVLIWKKYIPKGTNRNEAVPAQDGAPAEEMHLLTLSTNQNGAVSAQDGINPNGAVSEQDGSPEEVTNPLYPMKNENADANSCCYCGLPAGQLYHEIPDIAIKMDHLSQHLTDEKTACNRIFNWLSGRNVANNRIGNTDDLHRKIYIELLDITLAKFFLAFKKIEMGGVLEKIHDEFHPKE